MGTIKARIFKRKAMVKRPIISRCSTPVSGNPLVFDMKKRYTGRASRITTNPTKDIATITYQTTHSITVARYRLRNKLKLERDDNLVSFLSKF